MSVNSSRNNKDDNTNNSNNIVSNGHGDDYENVNDNSKGDYDDEQC